VETGSTNSGECSTEGFCENVNELMYSTKEGNFLTSFSKKSLQKQSLSLRRWLVVTF